jgi:uncharacterized membrane protein YphA (DoxX/SURF4 family)
MFMRVLTNIARVIVGLLFIVSGLVKANDPTGLAIKMTEFFNVWQISNTSFLFTYAFSLSVIMILFEVLAGVAILLGWRIKLFSTLTLLLIIFFTFLTAYAYFTGEPKTCGCFGDCIPLSSKQSFTKDLVLLALTLLIFTYSYYIKPLLNSKISAIILLVAAILTGWFMYYVKKHLPVKDCLAFPVGTNLRLAKYGSEEDAKLKKDFGKNVFYVYAKKTDTLRVSLIDMVDPTKNYGSLEDSGFTYLYTDTILPKQKGSPIVANDLNANLRLSFRLADADGVEVTDKILKTVDRHFLLYIKKVDQTGCTGNAIKAALEVSKTHEVYTVTQNAWDIVKLKLPRIMPLQTNDDVPIKAIARSNATLLIIEDGVIKAKYGCADVKEGFNKWLLNK